MSYPTVANPFQTDSGNNPSQLGQQSDEEKAKNAQKYLQVLAQVRLPWEPQIDNLIMYVNHGRRSVQDRDLWPGQPTGMEVYDDSAMLAANMLVDGMAGYMCSRNQAWFALEIPGKLNFPRTSKMRAWTGKRVDSYPEVQKWLQNSQDVMYSAFNRSNFYDVVPEFFRDGAVCGTGSFLTEEEIETASIVCTVPHFRQCFIAENRHGMVDTNYRVYKMTLRQLAQQFGMTKMKEAEVDFEVSYKSNMHAEREVLHAVYPRKDYQPWRIDAKGKKWESIWVYWQGGKILSSNSSPSGQEKITLLSEGGYETMPTITWRWNKNSDEVYGRGPAHNAWVAIAKANQMGRTNLITGQKAAEPPLVAYSDQRGQIQRGPNGITFLESNRGDIRMRAPMPLNGTGVQNLPFTIEFQEREAQIINQHFHSDIFTLLSQIGQQKGMGRPVTEQIFEMQSEKSAVLGTRIGRLQWEFFDPLIARFFDIESRAGRIPEVPQILLESEHSGVSVQYLGMLAQAQTRVQKVRSIQTSVALAMQITQFDPLAIHAIDTDEMMREAMDASGMPASVMRDPKAIVQIRQMAEKERQQQQQVENAPKIAKAASLAGKSAEPDSPLRKMLGGGKEPGE